MYIPQNKVTKDRITQKKYNRIVIFLQNSSPLYLFKKKKDAIPFEIKVVLSSTCNLVEV